MRISSNSSRLAAFALLVGGLISIVAIACGSEAATATPIPATATTAPVVQPTATARPAATATAAPAATATAAPTATATARPAATATPAPVKNTEIVFAVSQIFPVAGQVWQAAYANTSPMGVTEPLFRYDAKTSDPMGAHLGTGWKVSENGLELTMTVRQGVPWNAPKGLESFQAQLGNVTAQDIVDWLNTCNATVTPESTCGDAGDFAAYGGKAVAVDATTIKQPLNVPTYYCTPYTMFGCLNAAQAPSLTLKAISVLGKPVASAYRIGSGPYTSGECIEGNRCVSHALPSHWFRAGQVSKFTMIQVPEAQTRLAMVQTGQADMAAADFKMVPQIVADYAAGKSKVRFLETMPGNLIGQSLMWSGNLWEEKHARTGDDLNPWNSPALAKDYAWIGDPWQQLRPDKVKYKDTDNPPGMTDMEQARLVRLAIGVAVCRGDINTKILGGMGEVLYSEYTGPGYPNWDPNRKSGVFDVQGNRLSPSGTQQPVAWKMKDCDPAEANRLLDAAGFPRPAGGVRPITDLFINVYSAEAGDVAFTAADNIVSTFTQLGLKVEQRLEAYGSVVSQRMRQREQLWPVLKNGDVNSNIFPITWPPPSVDTSLSRPGWGAGFESPFIVKMNKAILGEKDAKKAAGFHNDVVDYYMYWQQYTGLFQVPRGVLVNERIKEWTPFFLHYGDQRGADQPEFIVLK